MLVKLILGIIFLYISSIVKKDLYEQPVITIPKLSKENLNAFKNLQNPPISVVNEKGSNYGIFNQPILNVNTRGESFLPFYTSEFLESLRLKKWEFHSITNENWIFGFFVVNTGYVGQSSCYLFDKIKKVKYEYADESPLGFAIKKWNIDSKNGNRDIHWKNGDNEMIFNFNYEKKQYDLSISLELSGKKVNGKFTFSKYFPSSNEFSIVFPFSDSQTAYSHKSSPLKVEGELVFDGEKLDLKNAVATLDYTHSYEKRITTWKWSSIGGRSGNNTILINLTSMERFLQHENVVFINDKMYFVGEVIFEEPTLNSTEQRVHNRKGTLDLTFKPLSSQNVDLYLLLVHSKFSQQIGTYHGTIYINGVTHKIDGLLGVKENHYAKW